MSSLILRSPAKVNLFLKVINKRSDGYHNIVTLFERINLSDEIRLKSNATGKIRIFCNNPQVPKGPKNLVYQVARLLQEEGKISQGVDITIKKNIPVAAGLAGGSSNAATVLLGLNRLWNLKLSQKQLLVYAAQLGSDISFFLYDTSWALGTQRGEKIKSLNLKNQLWHVLVVPRVKIYSREVYEGLNLKLTKKESNVNILLRYLQKRDFHAVGAAMTNDLEASIVRQFPPLLKLKNKISSLNPLGVLISGSGPCVFALTTSVVHARRIAAILKRRYSRVFVVRTL